MKQTSIVSIQKTGLSLTIREITLRQPLLFYSRSSPLEAITFLYQ